MTVRKLYRFTAPAALVLAGMTACEDAGSSPTASATELTPAHASHIDPVTDPEVLKWLAELRQATVAYKDLAAASAAGWSDPILPCMELEGTGGMGQHYIDMAQMGVLTPNDLAPELLVYEPQKNGRQRLVAVEYAVPIAAWGEVAPVLHGITFHRNDGLGLWVLHAWIWKHNPAGMFEDWNPEVNCDYAPPAS